jgi:PKD repeat protein
MMRVLGLAAALAAAVALVLVTILFLDRTDTAAEPAAKIHFTAAGDFAATEDAAAVLTKSASLSPDFTLALGDLSYGAPGGEQAWCDFVTGKVGTGFPFELISGNHESDGRDGNINDFAACLPNRLPGIVGTYGREWYVDVPAEKPLARFVMISPGLTFTGDDYWNYLPGSEHYVWTESAIDGARDNGIPWVIVGNHMPCLSLGEYSCAAGEELTNLLVSKKVDLVLNGHEHLYQRTFQLGHQEGCSAIVPDAVDEECITDTDSSLQQGRGTVFATVGTGGVPLRDANPTDPEAGYFAARSGSNSNPTFGLLDVSVTEQSISADFVRAAGGTFGDSFTVTKDATGGRGSAASFTEECSGLACSLDASTPLAAEGARSYAWDFGNGETATGVRPTVTYGTSGNYDITLTVTEEGGGSTTTSKEVSVTDGSGAASTIEDLFERTAGTGWGEAENGGGWTEEGEPGSFLVSDGRGMIQLAAPGQGAATFLDSMSSSSVDLRTAVGVDKRPVGGSLYLRLITRQTERAGAYRTFLQFSPAGEVRLSLDRVKDDGTEVEIAKGLTIPDVVLAGGETVNLRTQATGTNPTTLRAKVWKVGDDEPSAWQIEARDSTPGLQAPGGVGINAYLSKQATNFPLRAHVDELTGGVAQSDSAPER